MFKKIAIGVLAVAATSTVALSMPAAAQADSYDYSDSWGPVFAKHHQAKAEGWVGVTWDDEEESNEVTVKGRLYDLDNRTYRQGGKCAYVVFQGSDAEGEWDTVYAKKYCGYPGYKKFGFEEHDVHALRAKVCQIPPHGGYPTKCGRWDYLYTAESD